MAGKYHEQYNDIKEHLWDSPRRDIYIKFANELDNMINKSFRAKRLQNDLADIINFYKSIPKDIQLYYLYRALTITSKKRLIILPYLMVENIKYINISKNEAYIFDLSFTKILVSEYFSNQNLLTFLIGIQNLLPYIFLYMYNNKYIINIINIIINYCMNTPSLKYLSRSVAISMLNHIKDYNINIDILNYYDIVKIYNKLFQENLNDIDLFEFCIYILSKTNNYTVYNEFIDFLINYINYLFQNYNDNEYNNIKVMFCNITIKYKNELVNNLERLLQDREKHIIDSIKKFIYQCEEFLTLIEMKE